MDKFFYLQENERPFKNSYVIEHFGLLNCVAVYWL
jgi:hypothetical protein